MLFRSVMHQTDWLWRLMSTLKNEYSIERVNILAHSMGGVTVLNYLSKFGISDRVPHVEKVVTLGVPFNDLEVGKDGKEIEYRPLTPNGPSVMTPLFRLFAGTGYFNTSCFSAENLLSLQQENTGRLRLPLFYGCRPVFRPGFP